MKPNRPFVVNYCKNYITVSWEKCDFVILKELLEVDNLTNVKNADWWYVLEKKDRILGWCAVYKGFQTQAKIGPLAPSEYYEFRLKITNGCKNSDWSDILFAMTKGELLLDFIADDIVPVAQLHRAVENGPVTSLRKILGQRHSSVNIPNKRGQTPLRLAILKNNLNFMGILLNHGADIDSPEPGSERTPLMTAALRGQLDAVQLLLEKGSSWSTKDRNGLTALNYAVDNSHLETVQFAVENGADTKTKDKFGWSPLMRGVILKASLEVLEYLLNNGCDPNEVDEKRQTVLMQAVLSGRPEVVELLLKKGVDIKVKNIYGHTAFDMAKFSVHEKIAKIAYLLGKEPEEGLNNVKNKSRELN